VRKSCRYPRAVSFAVRHFLLLVPVLFALTLVACDGDAPATSTVSTTATFNVSTTTCQNADNRTFRRVALTDHAAVWADDRNPTPTLTDAEYQAIADSFEAVVWPTNTRVFGQPSDVDGNGRVHILYTTAVNALSPQSSSAYIGGFYFARDLFPRTAGTFKGVSFSEACPTSNQGEFFYMLAPDENGTINSNVRTRSQVRHVTLGTLAHEFQHLINASIRVYRSGAYYEDTWLDEGLSHIAEELAFYTAGASQPLQNYDLNAIRASEARRLAFNKMMSQNTTRFNAYLQKGPTTSPYDTNDSLATRGGAWALLRYLADRKGGDQEAFFRTVAQSGVQGMASIQRGLGGVDPYPYLNGFHLSAFADDKVATTASLQQPSWNFRDVLTLYGGYGVTTFPLTAGVTKRVTVDGGGTALLPVGVGPLAEGTVRVGEAGVLPVGTCTTGAERVTLAVGEAKTFAAGPAAMCLVGGTTGAEFVLSAVHASPAPSRDPNTGDEPDNERLTLHALATNTTPVTLSSAFAGASPSLNLSAAEQAEAATEAASRAIEMDIRRRERTLVLPGNRMRPSFNRLGAAGINSLVVSVLRTK